MTAKHFVIGVINFDVIVDCLALCPPMTLNSGAAGGYSLSAGGAWRHWDRDVRGMVTCAAMKQRVLMCLSGMGQMVVAARGTS